MKSFYVVLIFWISSSLIDILYAYGESTFKNEIFPISISIFAQFTVVTIWMIKYLTCIWPHQRSKTDFAHRGSSLFTDYICGILIFGIPTLLYQDRHIPFSYVNLYLAPLCLFGVFSKQYKLVFSFTAMAPFVSFIAVGITFFAYRLSSCLPFYDSSILVPIIFAAFSFYTGIYIIYTKKTQCEYTLSAVFIASGSLTVVLIHFLFKIKSISNLVNLFEKVPLDLLYIPIIIGITFYPIYFMLFSYITMQNTFYQFSILSSISFVIDAAYFILRTAEDVIAGTIVCFVVGIALIILAASTMNNKENNYNILIM